MTTVKEFPDYDERSIMQRISDGSTAGLAHPARQEAAMRLHRRGLITFVWGEGKDAGIMLVRKAPTGKPPPYPPFGGGQRA